MIFPRDTHSFQFLLNLSCISCSRRSCLTPGLTSSRILGKEYSSTNIAEIGTMIYNTEGESSFFSLSPVVDTRLVYRLVSQLHHPHRSPMGLSIKPCGGQSGGGWALPLLLLPSHSAEPHPPSLHTTKIKGMERNQATHPRQM